MINREFDEEIDKMLRSFIIKLKTHKEFEEFKDFTLEEIVIISAIKIAFILQRMTLSPISDGVNYKVGFTDEGVLVEFPNEELRLYPLSFPDLLDVYTDAVAEKNNEILKIFKMLGIVDKQDFFPAILLADLDISFNNPLFANSEFLLSVKETSNIRKVIKDLPDEEKPERKIIIN